MVWHLSWADTDTDFIFTNVAADMRLPRRGIRSCSGAPVPETAGHSEFQLGGTIEAEFYTR